MTAKEYFQSRGYIVFDAPEPWTFRVYGHLYEVKYKPDFVKEVVLELESLGFALEEFQVQPDMSILVRDAGPDLKVIKGGE